MELDLSGLRLPARQKAILGLLILAAMLIFGFLGYRFTVVDEQGLPQVLTWSDWRLLRLERAYQAELSRLQHEADVLTELLNASPDPVRAQITAERITSSYADGEPALAHQRELLVTAAQAVQDWAVGVVERPAAEAALQEAIAALQIASADRDG
jgi:hypothetical protein